jgi:hypothetical protein
MFAGYVRSRVKAESFRGIAVCERTETREWISTRDSCYLRAIGDRLSEIIVERDERLGSAPGATLDRVNRTC